MRQRNHRCFTLNLVGLALIALSSFMSSHVFAEDFTIIVLPDTQKYSDNYPEIFEANREVIKDPDLIYPGQKLRIPKLG